MERQFLKMRRDADGLKETKGKQMQNIKLVPAYLVSIPNYKPTMLNIFHCVSTIVALELIKNLHTKESELINCFRNS
jgi:hypothetical protein